MPTNAPAALLVLAAACGSVEPRAGGSALTAGRAASPELRAACELAAVRCTRCHTLDRVLLARVERPVHWELYVDRMRRQPESHISPADAGVIVRCLVYRSFGDDGLTYLDYRGAP